MSSGLGRRTHAQRPPALGAVDFQITDLKTSSPEGVMEHLRRTLAKAVGVGPHEMFSNRSRA